MTNRLPSALRCAEIPAIEQATPDNQLYSAQYSTSEGRLHAALFSPLHYEPNYAYPLLIWLHGWGDEERQLKRIMPLISMRNYVAVAPRGLPGRDEGDNPLCGWWQDPAAWAIGEQRVFDALDLARARFHVSSRRIFLAGFDCGGTMAFRLAMDHPKTFAGVLSLNGRFPTNQTPLRSLSDARRVPVFLACGRDSRSYTTAEVCNNLKLFHSAGMSVSLRQYPCGHEIVPAMLGDMDRWIMEQITAGSSPKSVESCLSDLDLFER